MSEDRRHILLTTDFRPMTGGIAEYLHSLWHEVARLAPVEVMTTVETGCAGWEHRYALTTLPPVPQRRLGFRPGDGAAFTRKLNTALYFHRMRKYAEDTAKRLRGDGSKPEVFIGVWDVTSHFWCRALRSAGIPYSMHVHGLEAVSPLYGALPKWRASDFRHARALYANSNGTARLIEEKIDPWVNVRVVNPGIRVAGDGREGLAHEAGELRKRLGLPDSNVLLTVCRLVPRKGIDLVLECVAGLSREFPGLSYVVAGAGPDEGRLREMSRTFGIEERVRFLGEVDNAVKAALYELCDIFVLPNRILGGTDWEGFGIVFLEAALAAKPAVGGKNGGVADAVVDGETGLLVNTDENACETAAAIRRLLLDDGLRARLGMNGRLRAKECFSWDVIGAGFQAMLDQG